MVYLPNVDKFSIEYCTVIWSRAIGLARTWTCTLIKLLSHELARTERFHRKMLRDLALGMELLSAELLSAQRAFIVPMTTTELS